MYIYVSSILLIGQRGYMSIEGTSVVIFEYFSCHLLSGIIVYHTAASYVFALERCEHVSRALDYWVHRRKNSFSKYDIKINRLFFFYFFFFSKCDMKKISRPFPSNCFLISFFDLISSNRSTKHFFPEVWSI